MIATPTVLEYWFDEAAAERACAFFPLMLKHGKGRHAGRPFDLLDWQREVTRNIFGWKRPDGTRRYRTVYIEVPRKNGKTWWAAGIALYLLVADGEDGAEVYSAASTRDQASLVFDAAQSMIRAEEELAERCLLRPSVKRILYPARNGVYRAIPAEAAQAHGFNASGIVFDELHTQPNRELWDVLTTSTGARRQPLTLAITTAGHDRSSICYELHTKAKRIIEGTEVDESFYPVLFAADPQDDWTAETTWRKANPSIDVAVSLDYLRTECQKAQVNPAYENTFRNLHLNQWTEQETRWLPMERFRRGATVETPPDGGRWHAGLDLGSTRDVAAMVACKLVDDLFWFHCWFWAPINSVDARSHQDRQQVRNWIAKGQIKGTPGETVDYGVVRADILAAHAQFNFATLAFDPWKSDDFTQQLTAQGFPAKQLVRFPQTIAQFAMPCERFESAIVEGTFRYQASEVFEWMATNTAVWQDGNGNKRPDKGRSQDKIDGVVAALMAMREVVAPTKRTTAPVVY